MKKNKPAISTITFVLILLISSAFNLAKAQELPTVWSLEDCINYAIENNIQIKQSELNIETYEVNLLESKLSLLPDLNASTRYSYGWGRTLDQSTYDYEDKETQ